MAKKNGNEKAIEKHHQAALPFAFAGCGGEIGKCK
jgi:hypothetical protein